MLFDLRRVYREFAVHVAPSPGGPDEQVAADTPGSWAIDYRFEFAIRVANRGAPIIQSADAELLGGHGISHAHYRRLLAGTDNLALIYPDGSGIHVAHARGLDLMVGGGTDNFTGRLLLSPAFEMIFELRRDILGNNRHTVAHEVGHCLGLADTRGHSGDRLMGSARDGLADEDRWWIHRAVDEGLIRRRADGTTWGSEAPFSYAHD